MVSTDVYSHLIEKFLVFHAESVNFKRRPEASIFMRRRKVLSNLTTRDLQAFVRHCQLRFMTFDELGIFKALSGNLGIFRRTD